MAAFDQCGRDSLKDWGVDPAVEAKIVRPVWAINPTQWLFESDYPRDMLMRGKESEVAVRLLVDASGKVSRCTSLSHFTERRVQPDHLRHDRQARPVRARRASRRNQGPELLHESRSLPDRLS